MALDSLANQGGIWDHKGCRIRGMKGEKALDRAKKKAHVSFPAKCLTPNLCEEGSGVGPRMTLQNSTGI